MDIPEDDPPWISVPVIHEMSDLAKLRSVDPQIDGRMPYLLDVVSRLKEAVGDTMPVIAWASPPFRTACMIRGNTQLYLDIFDDPAFVKDLLEFTTENCTAYGKALIDAGADIMTISNPVANFECISLDAFKEFAHPYSVRMFNAVKKHGAKAIKFHTCGNWDDRYDFCVEGVDIIHCDQVDLRNFHQTYADRIVTMGNIKSVDTMLQSTADVVREEALKCLKDGAPGGRYILSNDCAVPRDTPPENVSAVRDVLREWGNYPLAF
jgi:MtaA/CmuA family methyltransferase